MEGKNGKRRRRWRGGANREGMEGELKKESKGVKEDARKTRMKKEDRMEM